MPAVKNRIKVCTFEDLRTMKYKSFCVTGGEPTLEINKLNQVMNIIEKKNVPIYLYTNGYGLLENMNIIKRFSAINLGVHLADDMTFSGMTRFELNRIKQACIDFNVPLVLFIDERHADAIHQDDFWKIKTWRMNKCFTNVKTEDWFIC